MRTRKSSILERVESLYPSKTLQTGQVTSYVDYDDAWYANLGLGIAKKYSVLTTGQYSLTTNIDLAHYTSAAGAVTFDNTAKTIVDTGNGLAIFKTNDVIMTNTANNLGPFTVTTGNVAGTITCTGATFTSETPAGAVTFYKRESHSNACVLDLKTGLMWSRTVSGKMGAASDGKLPWTTLAAGYGIFPYRLAANAASLGGYADWRIPNRKEAFSLLITETPAANLDATAFPGFPTTTVFTSSTVPDDNTTMYTFYGSGYGIAANAAKTSSHYCLLVRGGNL